MFEAILQENEKYKLNELGRQDYVCSSFNHTKLVRRGYNPNKKTLMYIPCVSFSYKVKLHNHVILE